MRASETTMPQGKLHGKTALITGGSKGLGKAMAIALAQDGAGLALVSRDRKNLESVAAEAVSAAKEAGHTCEARAFVADVSREADVERLRGEVAAAFPRVDILINNAGINIRKNIVDFTLEEWSSVQNTNVTAVFLMCRAFIPMMKGAGYGRILNMTSIMSHISMSMRTAYSTSKAALLGMTKALALELAPTGITVNGISPGPFATEMNLPLLQNPELNSQFVSRIPVGRWGKVEEIGRLAAYLCSEDAGFITGTDILIDGGWCAQ
ncbi:MAG TPA: SDR family oxidoreductase [Bryobacteraceae bacterium]|jgi:NAD(P)-dependent dehydrogenase (short-subunit alcohol dehydrogenase family)